jgi:hypothetical protein
MDTQLLSSREINDCRVEDDGAELEETFTAREDQGSAPAKLRFARKLPVNNKNWKFFLNQEHTLDDAPVLIEALKVGRIELTNRVILPLPLIIFVTRNVGTILFWQSIGKREQVGGQIARFSALR